LDFISSTATLDRYHEIIDPAGWRLDSYRRNPVFQNAHNYGDILFTLGKALITEVRGYPRPSDGRGAGGEGTPHLFQRVQFATDINPIARIAYGLYKGAFLNAVSVGFIPLRWEDAPSDSPRPSDGKGAGGEGTPHSELRAPHCRRRYLEQELLEVSAVAIPANPDALALGVKTGAITKADLADTLDLLRSLTVDNGPWHPPASLAAAQAAAIGPLGPIRPISPTPLVTFARELRRILRRT
jgi:hypothetical protein